MKIMSRTAVVALLICSTGIAAAHDARPHHDAGAGSYSALAPDMRARQPIAPRRPVSFPRELGATPADPLATATGGPVGGLGS